MRSEATAWMSRSRRIRYSSPRTSTSQRSSGLNSTLSPGSTFRTCGPTATTSAQTRRFDSWAVAGIRIPPRDLRSPSAPGICTSNRSDCILMGCLESSAGTNSKVASAAVALERVTLKTSDGLALEGELAVPDEPWAAAVLAHPHPQYGGSMRSIVIGALFATLPEAGIAVLRFNFRGVEGSEGEFDDGRGERLDVIAALDVLHPITEGLPLVLAGWSFGADTSLDVDDQRADAWFAVAPPLRRNSDYAAASDPRAKFIAVPEHDQFRSPDAARPILSAWNNTTMEVVKGADHFLVGRTDRAVELFLHFLKSLSPPAARS